MKRRWPRFSLRTLIIVVLAIALCWTLTATWGVSSVFDGFDAVLKERNGNSMRVIHAINGEDVTSDKEWIVHGTAIAPFMVRVSIRRFDGYEYQESYFWFFGYLFLVGPHEQIHSK